MDLNKLYSGKRIGKSTPTNIGDPRSGFQRDFDRIIFSSAFRRLQNKTQVFPLPGSVFVHNRLTHSLEVASVGRSLGTLVGEFIADTYSADLSPESSNFYRYSLYNVISSACLCHDIGNPAFGHSGEDAIASYFKKNEDIKKHFSESQWLDFINFEGNANAVRILTQQQNGKSEGGLRLTYSTISAIAKYPCASSAKDKNILHRKKFGFFNAEATTFQGIAKETQMVQESANPLIFKRHPFVWLVEAADDICYNIIDLEDAHRLHIIEHSECIDLMIALITSLGFDDVNEVKKVLNGITDKNDKVSYLRAKAIHALTINAVEVYKANFDQILRGDHKEALFDVIEKITPALQQIMLFSRENIYNHRTVVEIENAGYNVMYKLLFHFIPPILKDAGSRAKSDEKAIALMPKQFLYDSESAYNRVLGVLDYVSGMTDNYATDLYRKIQGIDIGMTI